MIIILLKAMINIEMLLSFSNDDCINVQSRVSCGVRTDQLHCRRMRSSGLSNDRPRQRFQLHANLRFDRQQNPIERAKFNRKMADFVVCSKAFEVIAVVELDDSSHKGNEEKDEARDGLLKQAGVAVLRYKTVPTLQRLPFERLNV